MALSVMNFGWIRDLASNLGWKENDTYILGTDCLNALENIEEELLNEDVVNRNVHISLYICGTVKKDLIPILFYGNNDKIIAIATRILMNLSLPVESLSPIESALLTTKTQNIQKQLYAASIEIKESFLHDAATFPIVTMLRETMLKAEKHNITLDADDCNHVKNCLLLLRNILHLPEHTASSGKTFYNFEEWQCIQNKLIWNLFVQGLDGALLLMLSSKYRIHWTTPLTLIIALLYRNQNVSKVHEALELISSSSDTSGDEEESDGSKNSSMSLSSEPSKINVGLSDSGCILTSDATENNSKCVKNKLKCHNPKPKSYDFDIHTKLEQVQINDDYKHQKSNLKTSYDKFNPFSKSVVYGGIDHESSSCSESPHHKKIKSNASFTDQISMSEGTDCSSKEDSGVASMVEHNLSNIKGEFTEDNVEDKKPIKNFKAVQKLRTLQMQSKVLESDSSNEELQNVKVKYRSHPPAGRRGKSPRQSNGCIPSICMDSAVAASTLKGRIKYPLWEKRNSVTTLVDNSSLAPSDEDIGNLIKEFTLSFLHSGFSHLVQDIKNTLLDESTTTIDKSLLFWILSYFLHLAATVHVNIDHMCNILSPEVISYLVYECGVACENVEIYSEANAKIKMHLTVQLCLVVTALKEIMITIDQYSRKSSLQKDKAFFFDLHGKLASLQHLRYLPLLLFHNCPQVDKKFFTEDVIILNHYVLVALGRATDQCSNESKKFNFVQHLKHFSTLNIMNSYGILLENFKYNSNILNECIFTMMHHIAGDIHASESLIQPSILKNFSSILKDDLELEPYQEDLIMYILNKFSLQVQKKHLRRKDEEGESGDSSDHSTRSISSVNSNCLLSEEDDDLFWWYLQFEQDRDPITRISEHIPTSKRDILSKLLVKGIISVEKHQSLEMKMGDVDEKNDELLSCEDLVPMDNFDDEITHLLRNLVQSGWRQHLTWLQELLLETCYVKLGLHTHLPEPVPFYSIKMMTAIPLVPYTVEQRLILKDDMFLQLLKKIGFQLGCVMGLPYPRIPVLWTADVLFTIAARLGPMRKDKLKFSYEELLLADAVHDPVVSKITPYPILPPLNTCCTLSSWLAAVQESKENQK